MVSDENLPLGRRCFKLVLDGLRRGHTHITLEKVRNSVSRLDVARHVHRGWMLAVDLGLEGLHAKQRLLY